MASDDSFYIPVIGTLIFFCNVYYLVQDFSLIKSFSGFVRATSFPDAVFEKMDLMTKRRESISEEID